MVDYNHVTLVGNLTQNPETKKVGKRTKTDFIIAINRYVGKDEPDKVDFFNIVTWGNLAGICKDYLSKGRKVLVDGKIQVRSYQKNNEKKWFTEIVADNIKFLKTREENNG